jgi:hypothetical protein
MGKSEIAEWFDGYVAVFQGCARGERDAGALLDYWGVPLLLATDDLFLALTSEADVMSAAQQQLERLRVASYDRTVLLGAEVTALNAKSALCTAEFSWQRVDGSEIARPTVTFLLTEADDGSRRISALLPR